MLHRSPSVTQSPIETSLAINTIDLFCGCGGMSLGFQNAGFNIVAAYDNWKVVVDVYKMNLKHSVSLADLSTPEIHGLIEKLQPDVIIGGPPCQDFSSAGPNNFRSSRASLVSSFVDIIGIARPKYFVLENVPRLRVSPIFPEIMNRLAKIGYGLTEKVLDASFCGVPQVRKRLFVIGALGDSDGFLELGLNARLSNRPLTMREYFGDSLDTEYYFRVPTNYGRRGVFSVDEPCMTIRAVDRPIPKGYPRHPEDPVPIGPKVRALTIMERGYVQTFPSSFVFDGTKTDLNKMIGNAVPVKLAEFVARALFQYIHKRSLNQAINL